MNNQVRGGMLRKKLTSLTHKNLPLAMFLETSDLGYPAWGGGKNQKVSDDEIIGYKFINFGKMMDFIKKGIDANEALEKAKGHYGQWDNAAKYIDPRQE